MSYPRDGVLAAITAIAGAISLVMLPDPDTGPAAGPVEPADPAPAAPQPVEPEPAEPEPTEPEPVTPEPAEPAPTPLVDGAGQVFVYDPPGALTELDFRTNTITPGFSGTGWQGTSAYSDSYVFAPHMAWPLEGAGFANSQVYRPGGMLGGDECSASNYAYPWQDNFCETRSRRNGFCSGERGHQGQDIRPSSCPRHSAGADHAVAVADGYISHIGSISVRLRDETGRTYWYMHLKHWEQCDLSLLSTPDQCNAGQLAGVCTMSALEVEVGDTVSRGDVIGEVSDWFGVEWRGGQCRPAMTTDHLHFEIWDTVSPDGAPTAHSVRVPPYPSLVIGYLRAIGADDSQLPDWDTAGED